MKKTIVIIAMLLAVSAFTQTDTTKVDKADLDKATQRIGAVEQAFISNYLQLNKKTLETAFMDFYLANNQLAQENENAKNILATMQNFLTELKDSKTYKQDSEILKKYGIERKPNEK